MKRAVTIGLLCVAVLSACAEGSPEKLAWWTKSRFGMFIHFGLYATPARGEWVQSKEAIAPKDYETYFEQFDPDLYDPVEWAKAAKAAGMKYVVLTAKHHEGFCLWDTKFTATDVAFDLNVPMLMMYRANGIRPYLSFEYNSVPALMSDKLRSGSDREVAAGKDTISFVDRFGRQSLCAPMGGAMNFLRPGVCRGATRLCPAIQLIKCTGAADA